MEVTKDLLQGYRSKRAEILEIDWKLKNRWKDEGLIGNDVIFDYRNGYPMPQSVVGFDQRKYKRQQDKDYRRLGKLKQECEMVEDFVDAIEDSQTRRIFQMYFMDGEEQPTQKEVAKAVHLDRSRVSRRIDGYLKNAHKAQNAHV